MPTDAAKNRRLFRILTVGLAALALGGTACNDSGGGGGGGGNIGDNNPDVYVAIGDSITSGREAPAGAPYPDRLAGIVGKTVVNAGSGGARSSSGPGTAQSVLQRYQPARLLVMYGSNDATAGVNPDDFENNIRAIVALAKANQTIPVIATLPPQYDSRAAVMPLIEAYNVRIRNVGGSEKVPVANVAGEFGNKRELIQADGLHPSDPGNQALAFAFADRL